MGSFNDNLSSFEKSIDGSQPLMEAIFSSIEVHSQCRPQGYIIKTNDYCKRWLSFSILPDERLPYKILVPLYRQISAVIDSFLRIKFHFEQKYAGT